jgi:hypothetical protein
MQFLMGEVKPHSDDLSYRVRCSRASIVVRTSTERSAVALAGD